jgi:hypothetical protein
LPRARILENRDDTKLSAGGVVQPFDGQTIRKGTEMSTPHAPSEHSRAGPGRRWPQLAWRLLLAPLVLLASGCASYMSADVTSFHQVPPERRLAGQTFVIEPADDQKESLEFRAYADLVRQGLIGQGLVPASSSAADLGVSIRYWIDEGRSVTYGYPAYGYTSFGPVWGWAPRPGPGGHVHYVWTAAYPMSYGMVGTSYSQSLLYRRELRVDITDRRPDGKGAKLFEGRATSEGETGALAPVMPALVRALFSDFPGPNGATRRVLVDLKQQPAGAAPPANPAGAGVSPLAPPSPQSR